MRTDLSARLLVRNGLYSVLSWVLPAVTTLIVTPFIVSALGNEEYGLYAAIMTFVGYTFGFSVGRIATKFVPEYRATGNAEVVSHIISAVFWITLGLGTFAVLAVFLFSQWMVTDLLLIAEPMRRQAVIGLYIGGFTILSGGLGQVFQSVTQGLHRFDRYLWLTNINSILLALGSVSLVLSGYGIVGLLLWNLGIVTVTCLLFWFWVGRDLPGLRIKVRVDGEAWRQCLRYGVSIIAFQALGNILLLFERGWLIRRFGTAALTYYVVPMMLGIYFHAFISSIVAAVFPAINELLEDRERLERLYRLTTKVIVSITGLFVLTLLTMGRTFLGRWMGDDFAAVSYQLLIFHVFTFGILALTVVAWQVAESFKAAYLNVAVTAGWVIIAIPLMVMLGEILGPSGVAIGRLAGVFAYIPLIVIVERRLLKREGSSLWLSTSINTGVGIAAALAVEWLTLWVIGENWAGICGVVVLGTLSFGLVLHFTHFLNERERQSLFDAIRSGNAA